MSDITEELMDFHAHLLPVADIYGEEMGMLVKAADEIKRMREALHEWDALIRHQYSGSREAMSDMVEAAQNTAQLLYGDPPWPEPSALKGDNE